MTMWLAYGSRLIDLGELTAGQLTGVVQLTRTIGNSLNGLMNLHKSLLAGVQVSESISRHATHSFATLLDQAWTNWVELIADKWPRNQKGG
jgi:hypothetical protein